MFCQYCGHQIEDDASFCPKCGKKAKSMTHDSLIQQTSLNLKNQQLNRDVLISYLYQLQTMELSVNRLAQDLNNFDRRVALLGIPGQISQPSKPYRDSVEWGAIAGAAIFGLLLALVGSFLYRFIPIGLFSFARAVGIILVFGAIFVGLISAGSKASKNEERESEYQRQVAKWKEDLQRDQARIQDELQKKDILLAQRPEYESRLAQAEALRSKAYGVNIIPNQFRDIHAIYFLHEYLSTSRSTLENALLHLDLNAIKAQLGTIIAQNEESLLLQALTYAQNDKMIEQNERLIQHAISTEKNTERAAQYAEIAASNSEVTAFTNTVMASIMVSRL